MISRRNFLKTMGASAMTMALGGIGNTLAAAAPGREPKISKNDKVRIAYIGIGNRGEQNIDEFARTGMVDVTVLCDIDMGAHHTQKVMNMYPNAKRFRDFRDMFDKASGDFDAVCASVPDHMHFPIAMLAMANG
ncbi:MAG: twin-arginine translocation signal domain-containing protein, partial [Muribaculaceae bacterium]|nr:twin-arginine translocation signal domain-containing protein [Muribaculaceae bacterium]